MRVRFRLIERILILEEYIIVIGAIDFMSLLLLECIRLTDIECFKHSIKIKVWCMRFAWILQVSLSPHFFLLLRILLWPSFAIVGRILIVICAEWLYLNFYDRDPNVVFKWTLDLQNFLNGHSSSWKKTQPVAFSAGPIWHTLIHFP